MNRRIRSALPALLLVSGLLEACAGPPPVLVAREVAATHSFTTEERADLELTAVLCSGGERRDLRTAEDPVAWMRAWWDRQDPSFGTSENEALAVYRQRAAYLRERFPDLMLGEVPEPWMSFLRCGLWERLTPNTYGYRQLGRTSLPELLGQAADLEKRRREGERVPFLPITLGYDIPNRFNIQIQADGAFIARPSGPPPRLDGVWEALESEEPSVWGMAAALEAITWYELPELARRLLALPRQTWISLGGVEDETCRRLAHRLSYRLGEEGSRRLAALEATSPAPRLLLERAAQDAYTAAELAADLRVLDHQARLGTVAGEGSRGPHPLLRHDPERLLRELASGFPSDLSPTGWGWEADVFLALGPPAFISPEYRIAYYLFGEPGVIGLDSAFLGRVDSRLIGTPVQPFVAAQVGERGRRRLSEETAATELQRILGHSSGESGLEIRELMLESLHVLAPPRTYSVSVPEGSNSFDISADVVALPISQNRFQLFISMGIPTESIRIGRQGSSLATRLTTSCRLFAEDMALYYLRTHEGGFVVHDADEHEGDAFLVDGYTLEVPPGAYVLYLSALDPESESSSGALVYVEIEPVPATELQLSPILLAQEVRDTPRGEGFMRKGSEMSLYPGRGLIYGEELWIYYEITGLQESEFGDRTWQESYFIIPDAAELGVVRIDPGVPNSTIRSEVSRSLALDLSSLEEEYEGPLFVVVMITDGVSGKRALSAARFGLYRPEGR